jgi:hypothetical protein
MELVFRLAVTAQAIALFAQAVLAELALSGGGPTLDTHRIAEGVTLLTAAVQVIAAVLLRRAGRIHGAPFAASIGLLFAEIVQMAVGRFRLLALHVPLGASPFGASIGLSPTNAKRRPAGGIADQSQGVSLPLVLVAMFSAASARTWIHKENR